MPFTVENIENSIVKFVFSDPFTTDDMIKILGLLTCLLDTKKPFAFYVDARKANRPPLNAASKLLYWMKANKSRFKELLICSAVVFGDTATNNLVSTLLTGVFAIQPTVSPNLLTNNYNQAEKWINEKVNKFNGV